MTLKIFLTLLVLGIIMGAASTLLGKGKQRSLPLNILSATLGIFLGWLLFTQISGFALQVTFALGGGLLALWLIRAVKK